MALRNALITKAFAAALPPEPTAPAPQPVQPPPFTLTGLGGLVKLATQQAKQTVTQAREVLQAAAPLPKPTTTAAMVQWVRQVKATATARPDVAQALATLEAAYPPKDNGGGLLDAFADTIVAVAEVAQGSLAAQALAAAATGGLSLVAQVALEVATGAGGPVTGVAKQLVDDPLGIVKAVPGLLLTEVGVVGQVANVVKFGGAAAEGTFGKYSAIGKAGGAARDATEDVQQAARENPVDSLKVVGGAIGAAIGLPGAAAILKDGIQGIVGDAAGGAGAPGNTGIVPATHGASPAQTQDAGAATSSMAPWGWLAAAAALLTAGVGALVFTNTSTSP